MPSPAYYFGKLLQKMQIATCRGCDIDSLAHVGERSNLIGVSMGRYSYMGTACSMVDVEIGSFCSIASYCAAGGGGHPMEYVSTSPAFLQGHNAFRQNLSRLPYEQAERVYIGNDVWIGEACFIKGGVAIGDGAVVGAHSVVTKDIPPYAVAVGSPARVLRYRFDEATVAALQELAWWDWDDDKLRKYAEFFDDPKRLLEAVGE